MGGRSYDPLKGRFLQTSLAAPNQVLTNGYLFAQNDPINLPEHNPGFVSAQRDTVQRPTSRPAGAAGIGTRGDLRIASAIEAVGLNQKQAGVGYGSQAFVMATQVIPYRIDFANHAGALAPVQAVLITDALSTNFDWTSFRLTEIGFGDTLIQVPFNTQNFQTTRTLSFNNKSFNVQIQVGLNTSTGQVVASFQSIDPATQLPPDVLTGFLPPEDGTGRGKGFISYTIQPKATLATGTEIRNVALISFDGGQSISTDQVNSLDPTQGIDPNKQARITVDAVAPSNSFTALPALSPTTFAVNWSAVDDAGGSGVSTFDVYVSDNGGVYSLWQAATTATTANYVGLAGRQYRFQVFAKDNVGNRQLTPGTTVTTTVNSVPVILNQSFSLNENSSSSPGTVVASDPDSWQTISYSIVSGNVNGAFAINSSGVLSVANAAALDYEARQSIVLTIRVTDNGFNSQFSDAQVTVNLVDLPELVGVSIGDGSVQRSLVRQVVLTFDGPVTLDSGALTMTKRGTTIVVPTEATHSTNALGQTLVTLTFSGALTRNFGALTDGYYQLVIDGTKVRRGQMQLDTNQDGITGDTRVVGANEADNFFALYGDLNGDGLVGIAEFGLFRAAFGKLTGEVNFDPRLEFDGDGAIGISDFGQFRSRFGKPKLPF